MGTAKAKIKKDPDELLEFCTRCFASSEDGSWSHIIEGGHCYNCGSGGPELKLPRWAIDGIRQNASWVGKRYYPTEEDYETRAEIEALRETIKVFPGRRARMIDPGSWEVIQKTGEGRTAMVFVQASSEEDALVQARLRLPYIPHGDSL